MIITVKMPNREIFLLNINIEDRIFILKKKIREEHNIVEQQQRLTYHGSPLKDDYKCLDYNIQEGDTVYLTLQMI